MSSIASRITKMTASELREYEFRSVWSKDDVFTVRGVSPRQNVRLTAGAIVGVKDLNLERQRLIKRTPKSLTE